MAFDAGEVIARIKAQTDGFSSAIQGVKSDVQNLSDGLKSQSEGFKNLALGAGAMAAGLGLVAKSSIDAAADMETYKSTLTTVLKSEQEATKMLQWAKEFAASTPFEIPQLVEATVKLQSYGVDAKTVMTDIGNMAAVMGKDLIQAVEAVADAQTGEVERLKEFGITKNMVIETAEAMGNSVVDAKGKITDMAAFNEALFALMGERFQGGMAAMMDSYKGQMSNMQDAMGGVTRALGEALLPVVKELIPIITDLATGFGKWVSDNKELAAILVGGGAVLAGFVATVAALGLAIPAVVSGFTALSTILGVLAAATGPIGIIALAIGALVLAWKNDFLGLQTKTEKFLSDITKAFKDAVAFISGLPKQAMQWGQNLLTMFIDGIKKKIDAVGEAAKEAADKLKSFLGFHSPAEEGPASDADTWAPNFVKMFADGLREGVPRVASEASNLASVLQAGMQSGIEGVLMGADSFSSALTGLFNSLRAFIAKAAAQAIMEMAAVKAAVEAFKAALADNPLLALLFLGVGLLFGGRGGGERSSIDQAAEEMKRKFEEMADSVKGALSGAFDAKTYTSFLKEFGEGLERVVKDNLIKAFMESSAMKPLLDQMTNLILGGGGKEAIQALLRQIGAASQGFYNQLQGLDFSFAGAGGYGGGVIRTAPTGSPVLNITVQSVEPTLEGANKFVKQYVRPALADLAAGTV